MFAQLSSTCRILAIITLLIFLSSAFLYYNTYSFPPPFVLNAPGPATLPRIVLICIFLLLPFAGYDIYKRHRGGKEGTETTIEFKEIAFALVIVVLFSAFLDQFGFEIVGGSALFAMLLATTRKLKLSLILTVAGILTCYVVFVAFLKVYIQTSFLPMHPLQFLGY